jgi:hypothetical protein
MQAFPENLLNKGAFVKAAALVNPATILGPHETPVPRAGISLKHDGFVGFQDRPFGFVNRLAERGTKELGIQLFREHGGAALPAFFAYIHNPNEVFHFHPLLPARTTRDLEGGHLWRYVILPFVRS